MSGASDRPTVAQVLPLVRAIYARHGAGCCLHALTDDGNVRDSDAQWCLDYAKERGHADCETAAALLVQMSRTQRLRVGDEYYQTPKEMP